MNRVHFLPIAFAIGCSVSTAHPARDQSSSDTSQTRLSADTREPDPAGVAYPVLDSPRPAGALVSLCEDTPSGLHFRAEPAGCTGVTSKPRVCAKSAVREISRDVVVCAD